MLNRLKLTRCTIGKLRKFPIQRCILSFYDNLFRVRSIWGFCLPDYIAIVASRKTGSHMLFVGISGAIFNYQNQPWDCRTNLSSDRNDN